MKPNEITSGRLEQTELISGEVGQTDLLDGGIVKCPEDVRRMLNELMESGI